MLRQGDPHATGGRVRSGGRPTQPGHARRRRRNGNPHAGAGQRSDHARGHSYGGTVITAAGTDERVAGLVYIAALAPDDGETSQSQQNRFPVTDIFSHIEIADGRVWMLAKGVACFAGDLSEAEQKVVWATQAAPTADLFNQKVEGAAWQAKPSWYIVAKNDRTVDPELQRFAAKRMGATIHEIDSSHVPMLSNPGLVIDVIRTAANAVQRSTVGA